MSTALPRRFYFSPTRHERNIHSNAAARIPAARNHFRLPSRIDLIPNNRSEPKNLQRKQLDDFPLSNNNRPFMIFRPIPSAFLQNRFMRQVPPSNHHQLHAGANYYSTWTPSELDSRSSEDLSNPAASGDKFRHRHHAETTMTIRSGKVFLDMTEESEEEEVSRIARTMPENEMSFEGFLRNRLRHRSDDEEQQRSLQQQQQQQQSQTTTTSSEEEGAKETSDSDTEEKRALPMMDEGNVSNREATTGMPGGSAIREFPHWNEKLASFSEANVKADQAPDKPMDELVRESLNYVHKKYQDNKTLAENNNGSNNKMGGGSRHQHHHHSWMSDPRNASDDYSSKYIE